MKHGSLFSGIGGFDLASEWMGWENIFQVEWDLYCQKVLAKNFPNVKRYGDIKEFDGTKYRGAIDILSGGFPCQPFSVAGERKGKEDDRHLWSEYLRVIREIQPAYVIGENVPGIIDMELDNIINDLEGEGYKTEQFIIPACSVNAVHRRDRLWIIATNTTSINDRQRFNMGAENRGSVSESKSEVIFQQKKYINSGFNKIPLQKGISSNAKRIRQQRQGGAKRQISSEENENRQTSRFDSISGWPTEPPVCRANDGLPVKLDGFKLSKSDHIKAQLKGLGNAIVPQVVYQIFKAIEEYQNNFS